MRTGSSEVCLANSIVLGPTIHLLPKDKPPKMSEEHQEIKYDCSGILRHIQMYPSAIAVQLVLSTSSSTAHTPSPGFIQHAFLNLMFFLM